MGEESSGTTIGPGKQNRAEKKARKALIKLGLKPFEGVNRVTVKKNKNMLFVIQNPDVYNLPGSRSKGMNPMTYVIFGEAKIEDLNEQAKMQAAQNFKAPGMGGMNGMGGGALGSAATAALSASADDDEDDDGEDVDEEGLEAKDIELIMSQSGVSRAKALKSLRKNKGDIVNAILALTPTN